MKVAITGKGGVGKSTLAAVLALLIARRGSKVLAVDADPDSNLAAFLGLPEELRQQVIPIAKQAALIEERTGAKVKQYGQIFKLNPDVADIAGTYGTVYEGVTLLVLGAVEQGGGGCACPENVLIRALVSDLVLYKNEALIMDMEAGVEHLGRATAQGVDTVVVVLEPAQSSIDCAHRVIRMAGEIGLHHIQFVANKVTGPDDEQFIRRAFPKQDLLGCLPYSEDIRRADRKGGGVLKGMNPEMLSLYEQILMKLETFSNSRYR